MLPPITTDTINPTYALTIAKTLATMHRLNLTIPGITQPEYDTHINEDLKKLIHKSVVENVPYAQQLSHQQSLIMAINDRYSAINSSLNTSLVITHGDLDQKNVLWNEPPQPYSY